MADGNILSDFGINILEEEIDDVIFKRTSSWLMRLLPARRDRSGGYYKCAWHWLPCSLL